MKNELLICATLSDRPIRLCRIESLVVFSSHLPKKGITHRSSVWRFQRWLFGVASNNQDCEVRLYLGTAKAELYLIESRCRNDNEVSVPVVHHAMPKVAKRRPRHEQLLLSTLTAVLLLIQES